MPNDPIDSLLGQGLELAAFGMGTVFVFLTLLILVTALMSHLAQAVSPLPSALREKLVKASPTDLAEQELVAVIAAAISQHRSR